MGVARITLVLLCVFKLSLLQGVGAYTALEGSEFEQLLDSAGSLMNSSILKDSLNPSNNKTTPAGRPNTVKGLDSMWNKTRSSKARYPPRFLCDIRRNVSEVPTSVHSLTPADINVVGALGDSLTAGTGILASSILDELTQNRGLSWSCGGEGTYEEHITLPNILKKYNPDLYGYAVGDGNEHSRRAVFNVAVVGSVSKDLKKQAEMLVRKMKRDRRVDFVSDWKLITILTGNNDLCDYCHDKSRYNEAEYYSNLVSALDVLHEQMPRTLVNLVQPLSMSLMEELNRGFFCSTLHRFMCSCATFPKGEAGKAELKRLTDQFQKTVKDIALSGRYDTREDFTVVYQPLFEGSSIPRTAGGQPDMSYFAPDCFHLSEKGQAMAALVLWNNMISPLQDKEPYGMSHGIVKCPNSTEPYIYTVLNSRPPPGPTVGPAAGYRARFTISSQLLAVMVVGGVSVVIIGSAVVVSVARRLHKRRLYVQIPQQTALESKDVRFFY